MPLDVRFVLCRKGRNAVGILFVNGILSLLATFVRTIGILFATVLRHFLCKLFQSDAAGIISFLLTTIV